METTTDPAGLATGEGEGSEPAAHEDTAPSLRDTPSQIAEQLQAEEVPLRDRHVAGWDSRDSKAISRGLRRSDVTPLSSRWSAALRLGFFLCALYLFFVSIDLMSAAFGIMGKGFTLGLLRTASDPMAGLIIGLLITSLVQSSSCTTSIAVGLVASGAMPLRLVVPILMGANIGTTITNTIVSLGHVTRRREFERAFAAGTVHDFFNVLAVLVLFPLEIFLHPVERVAVVMGGTFEGVGGVQLMSPLKVIVKPVTEALVHLLPQGLPLLLLALLVLFVSLSQMVRMMRLIVMTRVEALFDRVLFRNDLAGFLLGWILTAIVQSSSAITSIVVPLVGTGVLSVRKIFPYTLGANLGTTVTAILAALAIGSPAGITVAFAHMVFNVFGIVLFYPLRNVPIALANGLGRVAARSQKSSAFIISVYIVAHGLPILYILLRNMPGR